MNRLSAALSATWRALKGRARHTATLPAPAAVTRYSGPPWLRARRPASAWPSMLPLTAEIVSQLSTRAAIQAYYALADLPAQRALRAAGWAV